MYTETSLRSILKALSWRVLGSLATTAVAFALTRRAKIAVLVGAFEFVSKLIVYFVHERLWDRVRFGRRELKPAVIWFTGLSGAGKSTIARAVWEALRREGLKAEYLDGDKIRDVFPTTGFSKAERDMHIRRVGHLASTLEKNGVCVVASFISPYAESRRFVRGLCSNFVEVHVSTPLEVCEKRDAKGLYAKARRGELKSFTGVDDPYEPPEACELSLDTSRVSREQACAEVLAYVRRRCWNGAR